MKIEDYHQFYENRMVKMVFHDIFVGQLSLTSILISIFVLYIDFSFFGILIGAVGQRSGYIGANSLYIHC